MTAGMRPTRLPSGGLLQAGQPFVMPSDGRPAGLMMRGAVIATYVSDDPNHPSAQATGNAAIAVYVDVLAYTALSGAKFYFLPRCLVSQPRGGMQAGECWKPRAATVDVTGGPFDITQRTNPANIDGDHVLVGFIDDTFNQPIVLRGIPHPSADIGNTALPPGQRMVLKLADGDPSFVKHHGTYYGVSDAGDFVVDTTLGNQGKLDAQGHEQPAATDASRGNHLHRIQKYGQRITDWVDASTPTSPQTVMRELAALTGILQDFMAQTPSLEIRSNAGVLLKASGAAANALVQMGDGAKHVAIVEALQSLWGQLKTYLDAHTHGTATGPSSPPLQPSTPWDAAVASTKVSIPNG